MSGLEVNTKKLGEIYKEWRGNESCYDNGRPVFDADELLDFAQFCLKHEANGVSYEPQAATCNIPHVSDTVCPKCKGQSNSYIHGFRTYCDRCGATGQAGR